MKYTRNSPPDYYCQGIHCFSKLNSKTYIKDSLPDYYELYMINAEIHIIYLPPNYFRSNLLPKQNMIKYLINHPNRKITSSSFLFSCSEKATKHNWSILKISNFN